MNLKFPTRPERVHDFFGQATEFVPAETTSFFLVVGEAGVRVLTFRRRWRWLRNRGIASPGLYTRGSSSEQDYTMVATLRVSLPIAVLEGDIIPDTPTESLPSVPVVLLGHEEIPEQTYAGRALSGVSTALEEGSYRSSGSRRPSKRPTIPRRRHPTVPTIPIRSSWARTNPVSRTGSSVACPKRSQSSARTSARRPTPLRRGR